MKELDSLIDVCKKSLAHDPWVKERGVFGYYDELVSEIEEVQDALGDKDNLKEELGDVLMDWVHLCMLAEVPIDEAISSVTDKLKRRKPYLSESRTVTKDEAVALWQSAKRVEKR